MPTPMPTRMVIAPHMDDESLGCGGLLAKYADDSVVVTVADSGPVRRAEHADALAVLGVGSAMCLGLPDGDVGASMAGLVTALDDLLDRWRPEELYLPFPSLHQDHISVYEAGMRSCRVSMTPGHWLPSAVYVYDLAVYDLSLYPSGLQWNVFEELTEEQADRKAAACAAYVSENPAGVHPMNGVKQMAAAVGHVRLLAYAEQYALVRHVRR